MRFDRRILERVASALTLVAGTALLAACGGSSSGGGGGTTISLSASAAAVNPGQSTTITAVVSDGKGVTWSLSPTTGLGTLNSQTSTAVTYTAPAVNAAGAFATITATSVGTPSVSTSGQITVQGSNVVPLTVDLGPVPTQALATNLFYTSVTLCVPGTTTCQTVDHIEVDTGSQGLRILESAIPGLALPQLTDGSGNLFNNCVSFLDGSYLWGPVQQADVTIGGEIAAQTFIQVVSSGTPTVPSSCSSNGSGTLENTQLSLLANGILGVGLEPTDCTQAGLNFCDGSFSSSVAPVYYKCPSSGCSTSTGPTFLDAPDQVANPVANLGPDGNGVLITLPALTPTHQSTVSGSMILGIGTSGRTNNGLGTATVFDLDSTDSFTTTFSAQTLTSSFIDSGSNAYFFPSTQTVCAPPDNSFYCPSTIQHLSSINQGFSQGLNTVNFDIENADTLFSNVNDSAFSTLGAPAGVFNNCIAGSGDCTFDWGAPFFYGKTVFTAIDGQSTPGGFGPFWAY